MTLTGDTFVIGVGNFTQGVHYNVSNLPAGLSMNIAATSTTTATVSFTGNAVAHANAQDASNLTITWLTGAFTNTNPASSITNYAKADFIVDFNDPLSVAYSGLGFTETTANTGAVTGSIVITLSGDTWNAGLTASDVTLGNVPAGLTPVLTRTSATVATLTFTGSAAPHANANDVSDITFAFADTAFTTSLASAVTNATGPASSALGVNFSDVSLSYGTTTFTEVVANNGSTTTTSAVTLSGDTFTIATTNAVFTNGVHYTVTNLPAGLSMVITAVNSTSATVSITGNATGNLSNPADVTNLTITWADAAFTTTTAANITNYAKNDFVFDFTDQASILYASGFTEVLANDGSVSGSRTATLAGDTYTAAVVNGSPFTQATHYTISGVPAGLTAVVTKTSSTVATITLTGNATSHADTNDIANLSITWLAAAFTDTTVASNVTGYSDTAGVVDFTDQASIVYSGNFAESILDNGAVTGSRLSILSGDTFHVGALVEGVDFDLTNKPAGLTAVMTRSSANLATLTYTGNAAVHTNAADV